MNGVTTIRPTVTMVSDVCCRVHAYESWIFNDCAIVEKKGGGFFGLVFVNLDEFNTIYYGFIHNLRTYGGFYDTREKLDYACENYMSLPDDVFVEKVDWIHAHEGHRYY